MNNYVSREKECGLEDELLRHRGGGLRGLIVTQNGEGEKGGEVVGRYRVEGRRNAHGNMVDPGNVQCK